MDNATFHKNADIVNPENICKNDIMSNKKCHHIVKILEIS